MKEIISLEEARKIVEGLKSLSNYICRVYEHCGPNNVMPDEVVSLAKDTYDTQVTRIRRIRKKVGEIFSHENKDFFVIAKYGRLWWKYVLAVKVSAY